MGLVSEGVGDSSGPAATGSDLGVDRSTWLKG
jgi:hypothetical protein